MHPPPPLPPTPLAVCWGNGGVSSAEVSGKGFICPCHASQNAGAVRAPRGVVGEETKGPGMDARLKLRPGGMDAAADQSGGVGPRYSGVPLPRPPGRYSGLGRLGGGCGGVLPVPRYSGARLPAASQPGRLKLAWHWGGCGTPHPPNAKTALERLGTPRHCGGSAAAGRGVLVALCVTLGGGAVLSRLSR